jgi:SP family general alpha glucoside:H+ symporter-like MFS transporter
MAGIEITSSKQLEAGNGAHLETTRSDTTNAAIAQDAYLATEDEHTMTFWQAVKRYRKACFWSAIVSCTIIMDGYDTALLGSLQAFPAFKYQFGHRVGDTSDYQVNAKWQVALGITNPLGNMLGILFNSVCTERFGHKKTVLVTLFFLCGIIFITF